MSLEIKHEKLQNTSVITALDVIVAEVSCTFIKILDIGYLAILIKALEIIDISIILNYAGVIQPVVIKFTKNELR